jgi:hypothetical protein
MAGVVSTLEIGLPPLASDRDRAKHLRLALDSLSQLEDELE